jgi:hypothetical protein
MILVLIYLFNTSFHTVTKPVFKKIINKNLLLLLFSLCFENEKRKNIVWRSHLKTCLDNNFWKVLLTNALWLTFWRMIAKTNFAQGYQRQWKLWQTTNDLVVDNLKKMNVIIVNKCCLCKRNKESVDHLLLHCDVASALWNAFFTGFGMSWVMPRRVIDLFACWC